MKKFTIILSIAACICAFSLTSCQNMLDKAIEGQLPSSQVSYSDLSAMYEPVSGVYATCRSFSLISWGDRCVDEFRSDFIVKGNGINNQPAMEPVLEKYIYNNSDWFVYQPWERDYGIINKANTAMLELDKFKKYCTSPADLKLNDQYRAEIRFWRALAYFRAARYYGNICWFDKNIPSIDLRLSPHKEVYDWLIGEIKDFREKLPNEHPNKLVKKGGLTRWAADMLLAKAAADVQDFTTMEQASGEIVKSGLFNLYPDYYEMLSVNGQLCDENILELQYYYFNTNATFTNIDQWYVSPGMATTITGKVAVGGTNKFPAGWGFSIPSQKYVDLMGKRGETIRLTSSIIYPSTTTPKGDQIGVMNANIIALITKYRTENLPNGVVNAYCFKGFMESVDRKVNNLQYGGFNNIRIFRYADALLLYAEALVQKNGAGAGDQYLNLVRKRANLPTLAGANIDQILEERGIELAQEWGGDRFYDLVRTGKTSELGSNFTKGEDEFFPTPQVQIDNQPGLIQPPVSGLFPKIFGN